MRLWSPKDVPAAWIIDDVRDPPAQAPQAPARLPLPEPAVGDEGERAQEEPEAPPARVVIIDL